MLPHCEKHHLFGTSLGWDCPECKAESGAPLQPGATQPAHDGVSHVPEKLFTHSELTTLLERMARLVVQEAEALATAGPYPRKEHLAQYWKGRVEAAEVIRKMLTPEKLQQLREAVERP